MALTVPIPHEDQTVESIAANAWMRNPWPNWKDASLALFGSKREKKLQHLIHSGWTQLHQSCAGLGYQSPDRLIDRHSFLTLFRPFLQPRVYSHFRRFLGAGEAGRFCAIARLRLVSKAAYAYCPNCATEEVKQRGYAYAHRTLQVVCVLVCPVHGTPTVRYQAPADTEDLLLKRGILVPSPEGALPSICEAMPVFTEPQREYALRFSRFVRAALSGELSQSSEHVRQSLFNTRLRERHSSANTPAASLTSLLSSRLPTGVLESADLGFNAKTTATWPVLLLNGPAFADHPIANLIAIAALFDDVDDFNRSVLRSGEHASMEVPLRPKIRLGFSGVDLSTSLAKDLLRGLSNAEVAERHGCRPHLIAQLTSVWPNLAGRLRPGHPMYSPPLPSEPTEWLKTLGRMRSEIDHLGYALLRGSLTSVERDLYAYISKGTLQGTVAPSSARPPPPASATQQAQQPTRHLQDSSDRLERAVSS